MWGNPFFTLENVRKSFPHIGKCEERIFSHWKMWGIIASCSGLLWGFFFFFWKGVGNVSIRFPYSWKCEDLHAYEISMWGKCEQKVRNFPHVWNWCKEKSVCRNSTHWKNVRNFSFDFPARTTVWKNVRKFVAANSTHAKCEGIEDGLGKCEETLSSHQRMWGNIASRFLAINFNVRKMWGIFFHMCGKEHLGHRNQKESFGWIFQNLDFSSIMFVCGVQVTSVEPWLQCHVTETNLCAGTGSGLGASQVCHQPSIWSGKRLTSQAPQVPPGFQARGTLRS